MTSLKQKAIYDGYLFEEKIYNSISCFLPNYIVRREKDIKNDYGNHVTGIDIEIYKKSKVNNQQKWKNHVFIQTKWKNNAESIGNVNHFIHCCNEIKRIKGLADDNVYSLYVTKEKVTKPSNNSLQKQTNGINIVCSDMDACAYMVTKKVFEIYNKIMPIFSINNTFVKIKKKSTVDNLVIFKKDIPLNILNDKEKTVEKRCEINDSNIKLVEFDNTMKFLKKDSCLYNFLIDLKNKLLEGQKEYNNTFHQEYSNGTTDDKLYCKIITGDDYNKYPMLHKKQINVKNPNSYTIIDNAIFLRLGVINENKYVGIPLIFFNDNDKFNSYKCFMNMLSILRYI